MTGLGVLSLGWPPDAWRVDLHSPGFESTAFAECEDAKLARGLRKTAQKRTGKRRTKALALADLLDPKITPEIPETPASARYMRDQRIRIISWVWKAVAGDTTGSAVRFDVIKPAHAYKPRALHKVLATSLRNEFRADLNRAAKKVMPEGAAGCSGFLIAFLHGEFEKSSKLSQLHWHIIATGDWVAVVDQLRKLKGYKRTTRVKKPIRATRELTDLAYALTYLLKLYWPGKWKGHVSG